EVLRAEARVLVGLLAAQAVVDVERGDAVPELAQGVEQAGRVGASRDETGHVGTRLDQPVRTDVTLDPLEELVHERQCSREYDRLWACKPVVRAGLGRGEPRWAVRHMCKHVPRWDTREIQVWRRAP